MYIIKHLRYLKKSIFPSVFKYIFQIILFSKKYIHFKNNNGILTEIQRYSYNKCSHYKY